MIYESYVVRICSIWVFIAWFNQKNYILLYFHVCETQRTHMHVTDTTATLNGHQVAVVTWDRSITTELIAGNQRYVMNLNHSTVEPVVNPALNGDRFWLRAILLGQII